MDKLKLYLDSTIFGFAANDKAGERHDNAGLLLKQVDRGLFSAYISDVVLREIEAAPTHIQARLERKILDQIIILSETEEVKAIAKEIVKYGIIPDEYFDDALHVATAIMGRLDVLISYNFKHLIRIDVRIQLDRFAKDNGLPRIRLASPEEVIIYER